MLIKSHGIWHQKSLALFGEAWCKKQDFNISLCKHVLIGVAVEAKPVRMKWFTPRRGFIVGTGVRCLVALKPETLLLHVGPQFVLLYMAGSF